MKKIILYTLIITAFGFGCKKISELTQFNMNYDESTVIPASSQISFPFNIYTPSIESNSESSFSVNNTSKDLIEKINLSVLTLTITSPEDGNFNFLNSITIYISADGLDEIKMAWNTDIPDGVGNTITLTTTTADLKEYIKKDSFTLRMNTVTDEILTRDYNIDIHSVFFVDAKILGF